MDRIRHTLELVRQKLDEFFKNASPRAEDWVVLSNIMDQTGAPDDDAKHKVVMFLANIQHETTISTYNRTVPAQNDQYVVVTPPLYIDLYLLFYANFEGPRYHQGLTMIGGGISFFQQNPWFTRDTLPDLNPAIEKLTFEFTNVDITDMNYLVGLAGAKYLPSVYYKVRMIPFATDAMKQAVPPARGVRTPGGLKDSEV